MNEESVSSAAIPSVIKISTSASITTAGQVDDAVIAELGASFSRWGRIQTYGFCAMAVVAIASFAWGPALARLVVFMAMAPAVWIANNATDRALANEFSSIGLAPELARRLIQKTYGVPAAYLMFPAIFSSNERAKRAVEGVIVSALKKC